MTEHPQFGHINQPLYAEMPIAGKSYHYFGGTAYLGIPQNENFLSLYLAGIKKYGLNNGTSRGNNVQLGIYDEAETFAAEKFGSEAALITSSGYLAAQLTVKSMQIYGRVVYAPNTHPALWLNQQAEVRDTFETWSQKLVVEINCCENTDWVIISNSMNNLYPEIYDFSFLEEIKDKNNIILIVDDSHGIGINHDGMSASAIIPERKNIKTLLIASMAKALGVDAGLVLGPRKLIDHLKRTNEFLGASPPAAAGLFAFINAEEIYRTELKKLQTNVKMLYGALPGNQEWHFISDFPVFFCKNTELSSELFKHQILISSFPYPSINDPLVNRIVLSSWHKPEHIHYLITTLSKI